MENDVLKAIKERRSIRRFKADQITDEELKTVLEVALGQQQDMAPRSHLSLPYRTRKHAPNCAG